MSRTRAVALAGLLCLTVGCTSFTDSNASTPGPASASASGNAAATSAEAGELAVLDDTDLDWPTDSLTAARIGVTDDGTAAVLLAGAQTSRLVLDGVPTDVAGTVLTDVVVIGDGAVAVALTADALSADPVLGFLPLSSGGTPNGNGVAPTPVPLSPVVTAPRGLPVFAAASPDGSTLYLLAEDPDRVRAMVYAVDPATGQVQSTAEVNPGFSEVTALALGGLAVTGEGDLVIGLGLDSDDERARGGTAAPLLALRADLSPDGPAADTQRSTNRATVVAVAVDADSEPLALVDDAEEGLAVVGPDGGAGRLSHRLLGSPSAVQRASGLASAAGTTVVPLLDQDAPTVAILARDSNAPASTLELCDGKGDAFAVTASGDGFLVVGSCADRTRLWELG